MRNKLAKLQNVDTECINKMFTDIHSYNFHLQKLKHEFMLGAHYTRLKLGKGNGCLYTEQVKVMSHGVLTSLV